MKALHLMIDETIIERVAVLNSLGLTLDENLSWKSHINKISNRISKSIGYLKQTKTLYPNKNQNSDLQFSCIIKSKFQDTCFGLSMC